MNAVFAKLRVLLAAVCIAGVLQYSPVSEAAGNTSESGLKKLRQRLDNKLRELQYLRVQLVLQFLLGRIEDHKKTGNRYPADLQSVTHDLPRNRKSGMELMNIYYKPVRTRRYYLFHKGQDGRPFTADDIHLTDARGYFEFKKDMGIIRVRKR